MRCATMIRALPLVGLLMVAHGAVAGPAPSAAVTASAVNVANLNHASAADERVGDVRLGLRGSAGLSIPTGALYVRPGIVVGHAEYLSISQLSFTSVGILCGAFLPAGDRLLISAVPRVGWVGYGEDARDGLEFGLGSALRLRLWPQLSMRLGYDLSGYQAAEDAFDHLDHSVGLGGDVRLWKGGVATVEYQAGVGQATRYLTEEAGGQGVDTSGRDPRGGSGDGAFGSAVIATRVPARFHGGALSVDQSLPHGLWLSAWAQFSWVLAEPERFPTGALGLALGMGFGG